MSTCETCKHYKSWGPGFHDGRHTGNCEITLPPWLKGQWGANRAVREEFSCDLHVLDVPEGKVRVKI